jgi:hypothetical protein
MLRIMESTLVSLDGVFCSKRAAKVPARKRSSTARQMTVARANVDWAIRGGLRNRFRWTFEGAAPPSVDIIGAVQDEAGQALAYGLSPSSRPAKRRALRAMTRLIDLPEPTPDALVADQAFDGIARSLYPSSPILMPRNRRLASRTYHGSWSF